MTATPCLLLLKNSQAYLHGASDRGHRVKRMKKIGAYLFLGCFFKLFAQARVERSVSYRESNPGFEENGNLNRPQRRALAGDAKKLNVKSEFIVKPTIKELGTR